MNKRKRRPLGQRVIENVNAGVWQPGKHPEQIGKQGTTAAGDSTEQEGNLGIREEKDPGHWY